MTSSGAFPAVGIVGRTLSSTPRGTASGMSADGGCHLCRSQSATGTTSTSAVVAILKGPRLNFCKVPSADLVPSAKATTELPFFKDSTVSLKVSSCDRRSARRRAMWPAKPMAHPMKGMRRISIFEMYLKGRGMNADSVKISR